MGLHMSKEAMERILLSIIRPLISIFDLFDINIFLGGRRSIAPSSLDFMDAFDFGEAGFALRAGVFSFSPFFNAGEAIWMIASV